MATTISESIATAAAEARELERSSKQKFYEMAKAASQGKVATPQEILEVCHLANLTVDEFETVVSECQRRDSIREDLKRLPGLKQEVVDLEKQKAEIREELNRTVLELEAQIRQVDILRTERNVEARSIENQGQTLRETCPNQFLVDEYKRIESERLEYNHAASPHSLQSNRQRLIESIEDHKRALKRERHEQTREHRERGLAIAEENLQVIETALGRHSERMAEFTEQMEELRREMSAF